MLKNLSLKGVYKSDDSNILTDLYIPLLENSIRYDRAVGYFSASTLSYLSQAFSSFIENRGVIRLVVGAFCDEKDVEAILRGDKIKSVSERVGEEFLNTIESFNEELLISRYNALCWLVAHQRLEVKIALRPDGIYHDKVGIVSDDAGNRVVFSGSLNESVNALLPSLNYESVSVYKSWISGHEEFALPHLDSFNRLWNNKSRGTAVIQLPIAVQERLHVTAASLNKPPTTQHEKALYKRLKENSDVSLEPLNVPKTPNSINGYDFEIRHHQRAALQAWKDEGDFSGIFKLATGAGKTITAIYGAVQLFKSVEQLILVVSVPYQNLADQWVEILAMFNIQPLQCYTSQSNWLSELKNTTHELNIGVKNFAAIVVVNKTFKTSVFQEEFKKLNQQIMFWIGDECHHHSSEKFEPFFPIDARFKIGLSATPYHYIDVERNDRLTRFYGNIVAEYSLSQAITDGILTEYYYYPHVVELTAEEADDFEDMSRKIAKLSNFGENISSSEPDNLTALKMKRARLVGSAANKLPALQQVLRKEEKSKHTLFYCGDGSVEANSHDSIEFDDEGNFQTIRQIEAVSAILDNARWNASRFTSYESPQERRRILDNFQHGIIDAMVAIKCLDEGIDVPACSTAYILASSRDPRQFIQRRGRILRRAQGKTSAVIHDFVVVLPLNNTNSYKYGKKLIKSELERVAEFSNLSKNKSQAYEVLGPVLRHYDLEHTI